MTYGLQLETTSIQRGSPLVVRSTDPAIGTFKHAQCSIARVEKNEDLFVLAATASVTMGPHGTTMTFATNDLLESHLYKLTHITLMATDAAGLHPVCWRVTRGC
jgi:hypothetical protein